MHLRITLSHIECRAHSLDLLTGEISDINIGIHIIERGEFPTIVCVDESVVAQVIVCVRYRYAEDDP